MADTRNGTLAENILGHMPPIVLAAIAQNILSAARFDRWIGEHHRPSDEAIALANQIAASPDFSWAAPAARAHGLICWTLLEV